MDFKTQVEALVAEALAENTSLYLLELHIGVNHAIRVVVDGDQGVSLQECMRISRAVEHSLDREEHDFSIEVTSAGVGEPLALPRQYTKNVGRKLEVTDLEGVQYAGTLTAATENAFTLEWKQREPKPIGKGKVTVTKNTELSYERVAKAKVIVQF